ncbi:MAG: VOC family protein [Eubacteriales bacterium]|nr:VOC family protein [Eubacteriales bacterium]
MTIKGLNHITFAVADIDRATEFYTQILGARLLVKGEKAVYMDLAGIWLALNLEPETKAAETYTHIAFSVAEGDLDTYRRRLQERGIELRPDRSRNPREGQSLYFRDPDGHLLELHTKTRTDRVEYYRRTRTDMDFFDGGKEDE